MAPSTSYDFSGECVVVTGGGRGLGRAIAEAFAASGATVVITGRNGALLRDAAASMNTLQKGRVLSFVADVTDHAAMHEVAERVADEAGSPTVLVNNAGINPWFRRAELTSISEWNSIIEVNLTAVFQCCQMFGRMMLERRRGRIINISSVAGHVGLARSAAYCAAKGGLELLTKSLAIDWSERGVTVNTVAPGYFETDLTQLMRGNKGLVDKVIAHTPSRRFGRPEEIIGACLFLASPAASYVTGQSLRVDGGFTAS